MTVSVIANFPVHPDQVEEFLQALHVALADTRAFEGCEVLDTYVDVDRPGLVVLWERWPTKEHHRRYLQWRRESGSAEFLTPYLADRVSFSYLEPRPEI